VTHPKKAFADCEGIFYVNGWITKKKAVTQQKTALQHITRAFFR
jgi:hypothetical protein